jgi:hypothetical protein
LRLVVLNMETSCKRGLDENIFWPHGNGAFNKERNGTPLQNRYRGGAAETVTTTVRQRVRRPQRTARAGLIGPPGETKRTMRKAWNGPSRALTDGTSLYTELVYGTVLTCRLEPQTLIGTWQLFKFLCGARRQARR